MSDSENTPKKGVSPVLVSLVLSLLISAGITGAAVMLMVQPEIDAAKEKAADAATKAGLAESAITKLKADDIEAIKKGDADMDARLKVLEDAAKAAAEAAKAAADAGADVVALDAGAADAGTR